MSRKNYFATDMSGIKPSTPTAVLGTVIRVNPNGIAYVGIPGSNTAMHPELEARGRLFFEENAPSGEIPKSGNVVTFTFDKIIDYCGEPAEKIGLREGTVVEFEASQGVVESVKLIKGVW